VREYATPPVVDIPDSATLLDDVEHNAAHHPEVVSFSRRDGTSWTDVTAADFHQQVRSVARGLLAAGLQRGDRVALVARTRYEWTLVDYAVWYAGGVTVPAYVSSSADQLRWLLADSGARFAIVEDAAHAALVPQAEPDAAVERVWTLDDGTTGTDLAALVASGAELDDAALDDRRGRLVADDIATIVYTSGTTGRP
jgi:long-chain acyl-CoA synthetase